MCPNELTKIKSISKWESKRTNHHSMSQRPEVIKIDGKKRSVLSSTFNDWQNWVKKFGRTSTLTYSYTLTILYYNLLKWNSTIPITSWQYLIIRAVRYIFDALLFNSFATECCMFRVLESPQSKSTKFRIKFIRFLIEHSFKSSVHVYVRSTSVCIIIISLVLVWHLRQFCSSDRFHWNDRTITNRYQND